MHANVKVKVCCIQSVDEAMLAIRHGASALGLVSAMPSGPGPIPEERIAEIARAVPRHVETFMLTCVADVDAIAAQHQCTRTTTIQLVDTLTRGNPSDLRRMLPGIRIVQVVHVVGESSIDDARALAPHVDALLLDSGNPALAVKELGGTGRRHDWSISRRIVESVNVPVWLAGGLRAANVAEAIDTVRPHGLDVCSGLREDDALNATKLATFFSAHRALQPSSAEATEPQLLPR